MQDLGIDRLSIEDRIALATVNWESRAAESHSPLLPEAQRQELERRLADHAGTAGTIYSDSLIAATLTAGRAGKAGVCEPLHFRFAEESPKNGTDRTTGTDRPKLMMSRLDCEDRRL
jgi:putative addiction module component (TIGR02574 family)